MFEKGKSGNPNGRPQGAVSQKRLVLDNFVNIIIEEGTDRFNQELNSLDANNPIHARIEFEEIKTYAPIGKTDTSD